MKAIHCSRQQNKSNLKNEIFLGREENTVEKGESTGHQCFQKVWEKEKGLPHRFVKILDCVVKS